MQIEINVQNIEFTKKGGLKIKTDGGTFYVSKENSTKFIIEKGESYTFDYNEVEYKDLKGNPMIANWINNVILPKTHSEVLDIPKKEEKVINSEIVKYRSMGVAYSKDLVVAGKIEFKDMFKVAQEIVDYIIDNLSF